MKPDALRNLVPFVEFKNLKNTYGGVLLLAKLQAKAYNFTKRNTPPSVFSFFLIVKIVPNRAMHLIMFN